MDLLEPHVDNISGLKWGHYNDALWEKGGLNLLREDTKAIHSVLKRYKDTRGVIMVEFCHWKDRAQLVEWHNLINIAKEWLESQGLNPRVVADNAELMPYNNPND